MSASIQQPPAHGPQGGVVTASRDSSPARPAVQGLLVGSLLVATLAACNGSSKGVGIEPVATASTPAATASATPSVQDEILSQYRAFWSQLTPVSRMPAANRRGALAAYVIDPELKSLVAGFAKLDSKGQVLYGSNKPRPVASVSSVGATAVVDDCQDSSAAGAANRADSQPVTKGVGRNHVVVTMKKSSDLWKVYFISYSKTPC